MRFPAIIEPWIKDEDGSHMSMWKKAAQSITKRVKKPHTMAAVGASLCVVVFTIQAIKHRQFHLLPAFASMLTGNGCVILSELFKHPEQPKRNLSELNVTRASEVSSTPP